MGSSDGVVWPIAKSESGSEQDTQSDTYGSKAILEGEFAGIGLSRLSVNHSLVCF